MQLENFEDVSESSLRAQGGRRALALHSTMAVIESRLPPLPRASLTFEEESSPVQSSLRRSRSYSGYTPFFELTKASLEPHSGSCAGLVERCEPPDTDDEEAAQWVALRLPSSKSGGGGGGSTAHPQTNAKRHDYDDQPFAKAHDTARPHGAVEPRRLPAIL